MSILYHVIVNRQRDKHCWSKSSNGNSSKRYNETDFRTHASQVERLKEKMVQLLSLDNPLKLRGVNYNYHG